GVAARLATVAAHLPDIRVAALLSLASSFCAVALGVFLFSITRDEDTDLAMMGLACRVTEGVMGAMAMQGPLRLAWLAGGRWAADHWIPKRLAPWASSFSTPRAPSPARCSSPWAAFPSRG